jgi:hypothetical protein
MYIMSGLLLVGFLCNLGMREVNSRHHYREPPPENRSDLRVPS